MHILYFVHSCLHDVALFRCLLDSWQVAKAANTIFRQVYSAPSHGGLTESQGMRSFHTNSRLRATHLEAPLTRLANLAMDVGLAVRHLHVA